MQTSAEAPTYFFLRLIAIAKDMFALMDAAQRDIKIVCFYDQRWFHADYADSFHLNKCSLYRILVKDFQ